MPEAVTNQPCFLMDSGVLVDASSKVLRRGGLSRRLKGCEMQGGRVLVLGVFLCVKSVLGVSYLYGGFALKSLYINSVVFIFLSLGSYFAIDTTRRTLSDGKRNINELQR